MKVVKFGFTYSVPLLVITAVVSLIGIDTLSVKSTDTVSPLTPVITEQKPKAAISTSQIGSTATTQNSHMQPVPAGPSPRVTAASIKGDDVLSLPSIGLHAPVVKVGLTSDNAIDVPAGMEVGYWTGSALPGEPGATFLDGHVDGVFAHLDKLKQGDHFSLQYGGKTYFYLVVHTETVALNGIDMTKALSTHGGVAEGLNIMTCAGTFIPSIDTYDQRFVVYSVRVG